MTIWSVLKLPKIAWPSPFKKLRWQRAVFDSSAVLASRDSGRLAIWLWRQLQSSDEIYSQKQFSLYSRFNSHGIVPGGMKKQLEEQNIK